MRLKFFIGLILIVLAVAAIGTQTPQRFLSWLKQQPVTARLLGAGNEFLPGPLKGSLDGSGGNLTAAGVINYTNQARQQNGALIALHQNVQLTKAAEAKVDDMFRQQYFEHESPDGKGPADLATAAGYEYLVVGENLALGNFKDDQTLVEAWMNSPGHRANILNPKFQEIGVAVKKGMFEGKEVWLAVQEFGTPHSACPGPSPDLRAEIETNRAQITTWQQQLDALKHKMETTRYQSRADYDADRNTYNQLADKINNLVDKTAAIVSTYNSEVNKFNECLDNNG